MTHPDPALEAAFHAACYRIFHGDSVLLTRIDQANADLAAVLQHFGAQGASLISACNPDSHALSDHENQQRHADLMAQLIATGHHFLHAENSADDGDWREPSALVLNLGAAEAHSLCRHWQQLAWVDYDVTGRGTLHFTANPAHIR